MSTNIHARIKATAKPTSTPVPNRLHQAHTPYSAKQTEPENIPSAAHNVFNSPGRPLESDTRNAMESRLGHDFSRVRIHNDAQAASTAQDLSAGAYTSGYHIGFAARHYAPGTSSGQRLLAHELTHVVQQMRSGAAPPGIAPAEHASEREAERIASGAVFSPTALPGGRLQRQLMERMLDIPGEEIRAQANLVQGFLDGARATIPVQNFIALQDELNPLTQPANAASYAGGAFVGILEGAGLELAEAIEALAGMIAKAAIYTTPGGPILYEAYQYFKNPKGYTEEKKHDAEMLKTMWSGLQTFGAQVLKDRTYLERVGTELGQAVGHMAGEWFNDKFMSMTPYEKGEFIGKIEGRILLEIALLFIGPEEIAVRVAPAVAKLAEGTRLGRIVIEMLEKVPALKKLLDARKLAEAGKGVEAAVEAPKLVVGAEKAVAGAESKAASAEKAIAGAEGKAAEAEKAVAGAEGKAAHAEPSAPKPKQEPAPAPKPKQEPASTAKPKQEPAGTPDPKAGAKAPATPSELKDAARENFNSNLRDGYAKRLGLGPGGDVHHAIELDVIQKYPGAYSEAELNAFENMRGIPPEPGGKKEIHSSAIRTFWNRHYQEIDRIIAKEGLKPGTQAYNDVVRRELARARDNIDQNFWKFFTENKKVVRRGLDIKDIFDEAQQWAR